MDRKVTALKAQKRNPNRVNVYLDDEYAFGLARIVAAWLQVGELLTEEKIIQLRSRDQLEVAMQRALRYLDFKPRTTTEVRKKLQEIGFDDSVTEEVLARLDRNSMLNDARFAVDWVESRSNHKPRGRRMLSLELRRKGVEDDTIEQALNGADSEEELAYQAGLRQLRRLSGLDWIAFRTKMSQFLARRGFGYDTAREVVARLWKEKAQQPSYATIKNDDGVEEPYE